MNNCESYADVLESYMIAEEGIIGSALNGAASRLVSIVMRAIDTLLEAVRKIMNKLKLRKGNIESSKENADALKNGVIFYNITKKSTDIVIESIQKYIPLCQTAISTDKYDFDQCKETIFNPIMDASEKMNHAYDTYKSDNDAAQSCEFNPQIKNEAVNNCKNIENVLQKVRTAIVKYKSADSDTIRIIGSHMNVYIVHGLKTSIKCLKFISEH